MALAMAAKTAVMKCLVMIVVDKIFWFLDLLFYFFCVNLRLLYTSD